MIRNCSLEEISDGKLYSENDMVKADTNQCQGCNSVCCHGMGDSIVLDPYDICRLTRQLQMPFEKSGGETSGVKCGGRRDFTESENGRGKRNLYIFK